MVKKIVTPKPEEELEELNLEAAEETPEMYKESESIPEITQSPEEMIAVAIDEINEKMDKFQKVIIINQGYIKKAWGKIADLEANFNILLGESK